MGCNLIVEDVGLYYVISTVAQWSLVFIDEAVCKIVTNSLR